MNADRSGMSPQTAIIIGQPQLCLRLQQQIEALPQGPRVVGWVIVDEPQRGGCESDGGVVLGTVASLEAIVARIQPDLSLITLPAACSDLVQTLRTRLRRLRAAERFMPTLEDQLAGVGPRSRFTIEPRDMLERSPRAFDEAAVRGLIEGRRVLITGAGGSIGSELARLAARYAPEALLLVERSEGALFEIDRQIARFQPDLARQALLHDVVRARQTRALFLHHAPDIIFHAAAHKHVPMMEDHPSAAIDNNLFGTRSVADAASASGAERFVLISTDKAVNPSSIMGATKRFAEMYVQYLHGDSPTGFSMVRFGNVLGSSGSALDVWARQIAEGGPLTVTDPRMTRYFMTIPEAASLVVQAAALSDPGGPDAEVFVLDMGEPVSILALAKRFIELHGLQPLLPGERGRAGAGALPIVFTGARPGEKLHEELARDEDALAPTRHPDIHIWRLERPAEWEISRTLRELAPELRPADPMLVAAEIRRRLPEMMIHVAA